MCVAHVSSSPWTNFFLLPDADLEGYNFQQYVTEFKKVYTSTVSLKMRENIFNKNLAGIRAINEQYAAGKKTWFAAVNQFTDLHEQDMTQFKGLNKAARHAPRLGAAQLPKVNIKDLPTSVDWRNTPGVVSAVKNQQQCGSCWTFRYERSWAHMCLRLFSCSVGM